MHGIRINLLPPEIQAQWEQRHRQRRMLVAGAISLVFFIVIYGALYLATLKVQGEINQLQMERQALENKAAAYKSYFELQSRKEQVKNLLREAKGEPPNYLQVLEGIGLYIPSNVWLTDFVASSSGELVLRGNALNHYSVANWLEEFHRVAGIKDIRCKFSADEKMNEQAQTRFEINALLLTGKAPKPAENKAGE